MLCDAWPMGSVPYDVSTAVPWAEQIIDRWTLHQCTGWKEQGSDTILVVVLLGRAHSGAT